MLESVVVAALIVFSPVHTSPPLGALNIVLRGSPVLHNADLVAPSNPAAFEAYVRAMTGYESLAMHRGPEFVAHFMVGGALPDRAPWTWFGPNGGSVRRIGDGRYRVWHGDPSRNWFEAVDCRLIERAELTCLDGSKRKLSAPDLDTLILSGIAFRRSLPKLYDVNRPFSSSDWSSQI